MADQNHEFLRLYGEALFQSYLIEDLLVLHVRDASRFRVNQYEGISSKKNERPQFGDLIKEISKIYANDVNAAKFVAMLTIIKEIRNKLVHHFVTEVGEDLKTEEGRDQINAMLLEVAMAGRVCHSCLRKMQEALVSGGLKNDYVAAFDEKYDSPVPTRLAVSEIHGQLESLKKLFT
ncbi:MAG TPA: hypothetical protein VHY09_11630 [Candidatus Methylacidiphilales bacterium]|jgi:hypothetical protein|nr:hypothetical protein [Candidatus Methylacidiphilales bacterium]